MPHRISFGEHRLRARVAGFTLASVLGVLFPGAALAAPGDVTTVAGPEGGRLRRALLQERTLLTLIR